MRLGGEEKSEGLFPAPEKSEMLQMMSSNLRDEG